MPDEVDESLMEAARIVLKKGGARDANERILIAAGRDNAVFALRAALLEAPFSDDIDVGRGALLLGAMKGREAIPEVLWRITAAETRTTQRASLVRALAEMIDGRDAFDDRVRDLLEILVRDSDRTVRGYVAIAFGALGDARSRPRVLALVNDADPFVRGHAEQALSKFAPVIDESVTAFDFQRLVDDVNAGGGPLKPWLDDLGDIRRPVREAAISKLVAAKKDAVPFLIEKLNQPLLRARIGAARALGQLQAPDAVGALIIAATAPSMTPEESELRAVSLRALANSLTGVEEGLAPALVPLATDDDPFVRAGALLCLGRISDRTGMQYVVAALFDDAPFVVESAAIALSEGVREEDTHLVLPLLQALEKRPARGMSALVEAVLIALSRITMTDAPIRVRVRHAVRGFVHGATSAIRRAALALLERMFSDDDPPPIPLIDDAIIRLGDDHPEVRVCAASFLARHLEPGFTQAASSLEKAIGRGDRTLSLLCLDACRRHSTESARSVIERASTNEDEAVATRAREHLLMFGAPVDEWKFVTRPVEDRPTLGISQRPEQRPERPSRVRAVTTSAATADVVDANIVDAKVTVIETKVTVVEAKISRAQRADVVVTPPVADGEQTETIVMDRDDVRERNAEDAETAAPHTDGPSDPEPARDDTPAGGDVVQARFDS